MKNCIKLILTLMLSTTYVFSETGMESYFTKTEQRELSEYLKESLSLEDKNNSNLIEQLILLIKKQAIIKLLKNQSP